MVAGGNNPKELRDTLGIVSEGEPFESSEFFWTEAIRASVRASIDSLIASDIRMDEYLRSLDVRLNEFKATVDSLESRVGNQASLCRFGRRK